MNIPAAVAIAIGARVSAPGPTPNAAGSTPKIIAIAVISTGRIRIGAARRIAVNLSPNQFQSGNFVAMVRDALRATNLRPDSLELEITERSLLSGGQRTLAQFAMLRGLGVRISIDDFGTGYSALSYLKQLPVDVLKIDQSFVRAVATDPADATITSTIVQMARALNLTTIAEGVETTEQMQLLASYGCSRMQGHLFSEAIEPERFAGLLTVPPFWWMRGAPRGETAE